MLFNVIYGWTLVVVGYNVQMAIYLFFCMGDVLFSYYSKVAYLKA